ncbi:MFS transporter [Sphingosinicella terrae]|uniref:MFS transporter n=1 Tax=Sphingosinicella terrae TaxID=2172047 RepID=UPI0013B35A71|nr:MFS transporter [Sphingosinicella terrae]
MRAGAIALLACGAAVVVAAEFVVVGLVPAMTAELALSPGRIGLLVTLFALGSAFLGPVLVAATARFSTSTMLAAALVPFAASLLLIPFPTFAAAAVLRVMQGAALTLFMSLAGAQMARARGTGTGVALLYVGVTVGATLAPPIGTFSADRLGWEAPMAAIGAVALLVAAACLALGDSEPTDRRGSSWRLLACPSMRAHLLLSALLFAAMFTGFSYVALLLGRAGLEADAVTLALLGFGAAGLIGNWLAGVLARWALPATHGVALAVVASTAWLAVAAMPGAWTIGVAMLIWGIAHAAGFVSCQVRVMAAAPAAPSFAGALNISAANIGIAVGSFAGGRAIELGGYPALAGATLALGLLSLALAHRIVRTDPQWSPRQAPEEAVGRP